MSSEIALRSTLNDFEENRVFVCDSMERYRQMTSGWSVRRLQGPGTWSVSDDATCDAKQRIARYNATSPLTYLRNCPLT